MCFLLFSSNRSLSNLQEILFWLFIFPDKIFRTNLMLELDSRGIQFPGHSPGKDSMLFCLPLSWDFCTVCCFTVALVLIPLYALCSPYMEGAPWNRSPAACKSQTLLCTTPVLWPAGLTLATTLGAPQPMSGTVTWDVSILLSCSFHGQDTQLFSSQVILISVPSGYGFRCQVLGPAAQKCGPCV